MFTFTVELASVNKEATRRTLSLWSADNSPGVNLTLAITDPAEFAAIDTLPIGTKFTLVVEEFPR